MSKLFEKLIRTQINMILAYLHDSAQPTNNSLELTPLYE